MKYSLSVKFVAVALCALMLLGAGGCGLGLAVLGRAGILSDKTADELEQEHLAGRVQYFAEHIAEVWASEAYGEMPPDIVHALRREEENTFRKNMIFYEIIDANGKKLYSDYFGGEVEQAYTFQLDTVKYEHFVSRDAERINKIRSGQEEDSRLGVIAIYYDVSRDRSPIVYAYYPETAENLTVCIYLKQGALKDDAQWQMLHQLEARKTVMAMGLFACLLLFAVFAVYLCAAASRRPGSEELRPGGLNDMPLDLWLTGMLGAIVVMLLILDKIDTWLVEQSWQAIVYIVGLVGYAVCLLFVGFCFAAAGQFKMRGGYWWRNSVCGRCLLLGWKLLCIAARVCRWLIPRLVKDAWKVTAALVTFTWGVAVRIWNRFWETVGKAAKAAEHFFGRIPLIWQWLGIGSAMVILLAMTAHGYGGRGIVFGVLASLAVVLYGANCFGTLMETVKKLRSGELETKVDDKYLVGSFREFAGELNGLADVAMVAAQKQLKSERMKTELITNVSHDIKTPLTSIINYVDLLEKPHTEEEEKTYLEVLHRQSQRMKKLIEDLMEMSKASTGNIPVEITQIDAVEAVNQALGEFSDKLTAAGLTPVFRQPEESIQLLADGRLLWRAMSNVLSNAVKYALPGTRLYVDVSSVEEKAVISFKNISGAELNISAEELMERFVRGDSSRNTEGSGLGLNIAKSLMELQKGELQLLVDGDLFKVTLVFQKVQE